MRPHWARPSSVRSPSLTHAVLSAGHCAQHAEHSDAAVDTQAESCTVNWHAFFCWITETGVLSRMHAGRGSRLEQIVEWCGGEAFDGAIVFDECHKCRPAQPHSAAWACNNHG